MSCCWCWRVDQLHSNSLRVCCTGILT